MRMGTKKVMKLSKPICKRCVNQKFPYAKWNKQDEKRWKTYKIVYCYFGSTNINPKISCGAYVCVNNNPPDGCPFFLEHLINQEEKC